MRAAARSALLHTLVALAVGRVGWWLAVSLDAHGWPGWLGAGLGYLVVVVVVRALAETSRWLED